MNKSKNKEIRYGLVKIVKGYFKGRFGYYDDDDIDDNNKKVAIIYFGHIYENAQCYMVNQNYITDSYSLKDLLNRKENIEHELWKKISDSLRLELIEEKRLIENEIKDIEKNMLENKSLKGKKVFLSHSSKDKPIVTMVSGDLEKRGIMTWLDAIDILPGEPIISKINEGLSNCEYIILFLSKNSVKSNWVTKEWETMLWDEVNHNKIKIIPVKLEECEIPKILQTKKYIDFSIDYNNGLNELINTINEYEKKKVN